MTLTLTLIGLALLARGLYKKLISGVATGSLFLALAYLLAAVEAIQLATTSPSPSPSPPCWPPAHCWPTAPAWP